MRAAVIYGTRAAEQLIGTGNIDSYDFVEVMTCPGGSISGGGQPDNGVLPVPDRLKVEKLNPLYRADEQRMVRSSLDNREIKRLYEDSWEEPMGELARTLLHTCYHGRKRRKINTERSQVYEKVQYLDKIGLYLQFCQYIIKTYA